MESPQEYYTSFQAARSAISSRLESLLSDPNPSQDQVAQISQDFQAERKKLNDATAFLSTYDRRSYESQLRVLEVWIEGLRNQTKGGQAKGSFAFKKKPAASSSTSATASPTPEQAGATAEPPVPQATPTPTPTPTSSLQIASSSRQCFTLSSISDTSSSKIPTDLTISSLERCIVDLLPSVGSENEESRLRALHIRDVKNSVLFLGYIQGSILAHNLEQCVIVAACHQLRVHNSSRTRFHLHVSSNAVIEDCAALTFMPYPESLPLPTSVRQQQSRHASIQDFSHLRSTPSPNWSTISYPSNGANGENTWDWSSVRVLASDFVTQTSSDSREEGQSNNQASRIEHVLGDILPCA